MVAQWQAVGFMHGVMNTDNMSILGLTIDYGPFQFMDAYDPRHICNHSDHAGRYSYENQPGVAHWNLFALGQALLPLIGEVDDAMAALHGFKPQFEAELARLHAAKLGQASATPPSRALAGEWLGRRARERTDFTLAWRRLAQHIAGAPADTVQDLFHDRAAIDQLLLQLKELPAQSGLAPDANLALNHSPAFVLRNYLAEQAIALAKQKDFSMIQDLLAVLESPYDEHPQHAAWAGFPPDWADQIQISCSS